MKTTPPSKESGPIRIIQVVCRHLHTYNANLTRVTTPDNNHYVLHALHALHILQPPVHYDYFGPWPSMVTTGMVFHINLRDTGYTSVMLEAVLQHMVFQERK